MHEKPPKFNKHYAAANISRNHWVHSFLQRELPFAHHEVLLHNLGEPQYPITVAMSEMSVTILS